MNNAIGVLRGMAQERQVSGGRIFFAGASASRDERNRAKDDAEHNAHDCRVDPEGGLAPKVSKQFHIASGSDNDGEPENHDAELDEINPEAGG